jgi:glycerol kinase
MYFLSIDQGTTSSRAIIFDANFQMVSIAQKEFTQFFPKPDWVEHDANEIWESQWECIINVIKESKIHPSEIAAIGITNQRETIVAWDKNTGKPICRAIVWQDRRTAKDCDVDAKNLGIDYLSQKTGLVFDAYFSASKIRWILKNIPEAKSLIQQNQLCVGTIDSWILFNLTQGVSFFTDASNASRTNLMNIRTGKWDTELLNYYEIPEDILPEIKDNIYDFGYATMEGVKIEIRAMAGDQQAALFGHQCYKPFEAKNTIGTGCFILQNTGKEVFIPKNGILSTIAWRINNVTTYALEGSVFNAGAALHWLKNNLNLFEHYEEMEAMANSVSSTENIFMVPAFSGLGTPYWDDSARGMLIGLTRQTQKEHIVRATLESIAFQTKEVMDTMQELTQKTFLDMAVDGGVSNSFFLLQSMSNMLQKPIRKSNFQECTALGVAMMCGYEKGSLPIKNEESNSAPFVQRNFYPEITKKESAERFDRWKLAVTKSRNWIN